MPVSKVHRDLVQALREDGYATKGFRKGVRWAIQEWTEDPELLEVLDDCRSVPDGWKTYVEDGLLIIEIAEVEVSHDFRAEKWERLWWAFDSTEDCELLIRHIDRFGHSKAIHGDHFLAILQTRATLK